MLAFSPLLRRSPKPEEEADALPEADTRIGAPPAARVDGFGGPSYGKTTLLVEVMETPLFPTYAWVCETMRGSRICPTSSATAGAAGGGGGGAVAAGATRSGGPSRQQHRHIR